MIFNENSFNNFNSNNEPKIEFEQFMDEKELSELTKIVEELDELIKSNVAVGEPLLNNTIYSTNTSPVVYQDYSNHSIMYQQQPQLVAENLLAEEICTLQAMSQNVELEFVDNSVFLQNSDPLMV